MEDFALPTSSRKHRIYVHTCVCVCVCVCVFVFVCAYKWNRVFALRVEDNRNERRRRAARGTIRIIHRELKFFPPRRRQRKKEEEENCWTVLTIFIDALLSRDFFPSVILHSLLWLSSANIAGNNNQKDENGGTFFFLLRSWFFLFHTVDVCCSRVISRREFRKEHEAQREQFILEI